MLPQASFFDALFAGSFRSVMFCFGLAIQMVATGHAASLQAGAAVVDISPEEFPVIVNAMFTERSADKVVDPLEVRSLVLQYGNTRIAIAVVDTCMMSRSLIDEAKHQAAIKTGIPVRNILVSATHTHSAPSAMGCLGSRIDPRYAAQLPAKIAHCITQASSNLRPARAGWTSFAAPDLTHNRRWIRRLDKIEVDPFGVRSVRAHMHPGHISPDAIGPSGPVDPNMSLLSIVGEDGVPLAVLGNFSMHYYESALLSSDYFGKWRTRLENLLASDSPEPALRPVALLSQGTSGDLMWMNYGAPRNVVGYEAYAHDLANRAHAALRGVRHHSRVPIRMSEITRSFSYRLCDETRLGWAESKAAGIGARLPQTLPEIYAQEQIHLHRMQKTEVVLQAIRIGELAINALPNEVFAITGLKLKEQTPAKLTMNIELANGGDGYIPPPEQHSLGGYTTWAARTAGLETNAEPEMVESLLSMQESISGGRRRNPVDPVTPWIRAVSRTRPDGWWRLGELSGTPRNSGRGRNELERRGYFAHYLPGPSLGKASDPIPLDGLSNHAIHLADGSLNLDVIRPSQWTLAFWFWNGLSNHLSATTAELFSVSPGGGIPRSSPFLRCILAGTSGQPGKLGIAANSNELRWHPSPEIQPRSWHFLVAEQRANTLTLTLDGVSTVFECMPIDASGLYIQLGGGGTASPLQGRLDEVLWYRRSLSSRELRELTARFP